MSAEELSLLSLVGFVLAAVFFVVAVILFFVFDIPAVLGELSGRTAAKQVAEIRAQSKQINTKRRTAPVVTSTTAGKATGNLNTNPASIKLDKKSVIQEAELLQNETELLQNETELLVEETAMLDEGTTLLSPETTILSEDEDTYDEGTTLLSEEVVLHADFRMIQNVVVIHTREVI